MRAILPAIASTKRAIEDALETSATVRGGGREDGRSLTMKVFLEILPASSLRDILDSDGKHRAYRVHSIGWTMLWKRAETARKRSDT